MKNKKHFLGRYLIAVLLCIGSSSVHAEWSRVGYYANGDFYIDRDSITRNGDRREVWSVMDYRSPQMDTNGKIYRSSRSQLQLDCAHKTARIIHMAFFSGSMLRGNEISKMGSLKDWEPVPPDSPIRAILDAGCGR
jgi:hypothetical protein